MAPIESTIASATANTVGTTNSTLRTLRIIADIALTSPEIRRPRSPESGNWFGKIKPNAEDWASGIGGSSGMMFGRTHLVRAYGPIQVAKRSLLGSPTVEDY